MRIINILAAFLAAIAPVAASAQDHRHDRRPRVIDWIRHQQWQTYREAQRWEWNREDLLYRIARTRTGENVERIILLGDGSDVALDDGPAYDGDVGFIQKASPCLDDTMPAVRREVVQYGDTMADELTYRANRSQIEAFEACLRSI